MLLGVEDGVLDLPPVEHLADDLRLGDVRGPDEDGLASIVPRLDLVDYGLVFALLVLVDEIWLVYSDHLLVGRNLHNVELVDLPELLGLGDGGTGHAREFFVEAEVVLQGNRGVGARLPLDGHALFRLEGLVQAVGEASSRRHASGELVDDDDFAVFDDVLPVPLVDGVRLEGVLGEVNEPEVLRGVHVLDAKHLLQLRHALCRQGDRSQLLIYCVVDALVEVRDEAREPLVVLGGLLRGPADDQRRPGLVDEDIVDLVHNCVLVSTLYALGCFFVLGHCPSQVVEAELAVGAVGDVGPIGLLSRDWP